MNTRRLLILGATLSAALCAMPLQAQTSFPTKPIRLVVPFPPGGSTDVAARALGERLGRDLGQPVVVENKPGAGTTVAAAHVASSPADGHTLYITGTITHGSAAALYSRLPYDPVKSFAPVALVTQSPFVVVVNAASRFNSLADLVAAGRAEPGGVSYGSSGNGAAPHLATEMLARSAGVKFLHVPYKGVGPALTALLGNDVQFAISDVGAVPHIKAGKLRALAVLSAGPSPLIAGVPGMAQAGFKDVDISSNLGIMAPAGTPADVVAKLNAAINQALGEEELRARLVPLGQEPSPRTAEEFGRILAGDVAKYRNIVRDVGIKID
ncbi:tripartite tricarboxylate transporter substrate binding protein [Ramlibacter sp. AW1]|uniref:Tripartite tricarboxylate transporter substrate binding protein n=1 Tax=Ramlibacter aurantiacus TaxID=2801330 RepID=A0A937D8K7_9BURK|nr:tripartite tricarboxylate transporter substrate binding protein [Ramlibacter aurantiacus]MBL0422181.1 tripartite tricarboxylate transporter substrate binding protein [Ramlibacter aurantiacus]